jgi:hypothetical protein
MTGAKAASVSARTSQSSRPWAGTTLSASPAFRTVGTAVSRSGPAGAWCAATTRAAVVGARAAVRRDAGGDDLQGSSRLTADHHRVASLGVQLARLEAQARVPAGEPGAVRERRRAPLLVAHEQQRDLRDVVEAVRGDRVEDPEREDVPALHVDGARPAQRARDLGVRMQRLVELVADDRVDVAEEQDPAVPAPAHAHEEVVGVRRGGAGQALDGRSGGQPGGHDRDAALRPGVVAGGRRDTDEDLEVGDRGGGDPGGVRAGPVGHSRGVQ